MGVDAVATAATTSESSSNVGPSVDAAIRLELTEGSDVVDLVFEEDVSVWLEGLVECVIEPEVERGVEGGIVLSVRRETEECVEAKNLSVEVLSPCADVSVLVKVPAILFPAW